jgi:hypothetical protein
VTRPLQVETGCANCPGLADGRGLNVDRFMGVISSQSPRRGSLQDGEAGAGV